MRDLIIYFTFIVIVVGGCSMYSNNPLSTTYHNVTAHYNAYFIANERMNEIENTLYDNFEWNYNKVLPIYVPIDSNDANSLETQIKDCIEKASIAIQRHQGSKWEDDSYVLVGKARYYALEYPDAIETFKYVNKKGEDDDARHEALIELIKTFVDFNEFNNAIAVSDYLKKEELNKDNQRELSMVRAYIYQQREDMNQMVQHLVKAEDLMNKSAERARIDFIIGQVYQQLGFGSEAYNYYQKTLSNNPEYELSFYTKLNMAQVTELTSSGEIKKIRKYFRKLLRDPKNLEYKDKIYYEMASFELKQGNLEDAIDYYKLSVRSSVKNQRQKAYSYWKLGQIYYDSLKNFELAKAYYDSTVSTMPKDEDSYAAIVQRQEILDDFVTQLKTIRKNDSLVALSNLPEDSVVALATAVVKENARKEAERKKREERRRTNQVASAFDVNSGDLIGTNMEGATWYFYNPSAISRGSSEFLRKWGDIPLEDNWRRSLKAGQISEEEIVEEVEERTETDPEQSEDERLQSQIDALVATVPKTEEEINQLLAEVEVALYNLGNIYNFNLEEKENAIKTFESLLVRFPGSEYTAEVLYQLYLLYKDERPDLAEEKANILKENFPETVYAKLIDNPNYREENQAITEKLKKVYAKAYNLFKDEQYKASVSLIDSAMASTQENSFDDNLALLKVLITGKTEGQYKYQYELNNFIKEYPESELNAYAQNLVEASENYQINLYNSAKAKFIEYFDQKHNLIVVYPNNEELSQEIASEVDEYIKTSGRKLNTGNLILNKENAMILINDFANREAAKEFLAIFDEELPLNELHKGDKVYTLAISEDNFNIFYQTKDLNAYLNFYEKHY